MVANEYGVKYCENIVASCAHRPTALQCLLARCQKSNLTFRLACLQAEHAVEVFLVCRVESDRAGSEGTKTSFAWGLSKSPFGSICRGKVDIVHDFMHGETTVV